MNALRVVELERRLSRLELSLYSSVRLFPSRETLNWSNAQTCFRNRGIVCGSLTGSSNVSTSGQFARISAHSTGLSSIMMKLSKPSLSSSDSEIRLSDFGCQLMRDATMSSRFSNMSDRSLNTSKTSFSTFLLHKQTSMPSAIRSLMNV